MEVVTTRCEANILEWRIERSKFGEISTQGLEIEGLKKMFID